MFDANDATRIFPRRSGEIARKRLANEPLGAAVPGSLGVRRVAEEEVDAAVADLGERSDVRLEPVDGRVVELPVPGVHDASGGGLDDERGRVRDRARHPHQLDAERIRAAAARHLAQRGLSSDFCPSPCSSSLDFTSASVSGVAITASTSTSRRRYGSPPTWSSSVREHDGADAAPLEVADVRQQEVDTEVLVAREGEPRVDDDDLVPELVDGHVLTDLAEAAERNDPQRVAHGLKSHGRRPDEPGA